MKNKLFSCLMMLLACSAAFAQVKTVTGTVLDKEGLSVIGASIVEAGTLSIVSQPGYFGL